MANNELSSSNQHERKIHRTTKVMIFTRTSSYILSMNQRYKHNFTHNNNRDDKDETLNVYNKIVEILNLVSLGIVYYLL